jgi:(p)ppGpp synthase/HD superfamily hydrolase
MDIASIRSFDTYLPCFDEDPRQLLEDILWKADYLSEKDLQQVWKAYNFALEQHQEQTRHSGEPYIVHPVKVL